MRDHRPVAGQVRTGDLLDPGQRLDLDLTELAEVDLRPGQQVETATGRHGTAGSRTAAGQGRLDELLHVGLRDAATLFRAAQLVQVHAQLAGEHAHGRRRVGHLLRQHAVGVEGDRRAGRRATRRGSGGRGRLGWLGGRLLDITGGQLVRLGLGGDRLDLGRGLGGFRLGGRGRGRRSSGGRRGGLFADFDQGHELALGEVVADLDLDFLDDTGHRGRHFHRGLVRFQRHQTLVFLDGISNGDQHLDYRDIAVVTDIGDKCFLDFGHGENSGNLV